MPQTCTSAEAVELILGVATEHPDETLWIGVDGRGAVGKTTFAATVAAASARVRVVHVDDFAGPRLPEWDWARFEREVAAPLRSGAGAHYERWGWELDRGAEWHDIAPGSVVVVEGVSATRAEVAVPWALRIWLDAPREVRLRRALERDGPDMMARWLDDWMPSEEAYIARDRPDVQADVCLRLGDDDPDCDRFARIERS